MSRKWVIRSGLVVLGLFLLMCGVLYGEWKYTRSQGEARRDEVVRRLDETDPGWRSNALTEARNAKLPPPEQNGTTRALQAVDQLSDDYKEWSKTEQWRQDLVPGVLAHGDDVCELIGILETCKAAVETARTVRKLPRGGIPLTFAEPNSFATLLPDTQRMREAGNLLSYDALVLAYTDRGDAAIESCHSLLNLSSAMGDEPTLISMLVRMALTAIAIGATERTIGWTTPTEPGLTALQAAFVREAATSRLALGLRGERASIFHFMENIDDGLIGFSEIDRPTANGPTLKDRGSLLFMRKYIPGQQATLLDSFGKMLEADKLEGPARKKAFEEIEAPLKGRNFGDMLLRLLLPAIEKVAQAELRTRATLRCATVALACERYRLRFGDWPTALAKIPPELLPELPLDPYTGGPLLFMPLKDGIAVYTTGPDLTDNAAVDLNNRGENGQDIGFRLFNPKSRRQEPPPKPVVEFDEFGNPIPTAPGMDPAGPANR